ncbi:MAG: PKD domain-containing protein [Chitinophagaceae bacterium]
MRKCPLIFIFLILFSVQSLAQRNNIWYFGKKAGISFNPSPGQPIPTPLFNSEMEADEGCASICDDNGDLLFYSNGITLYNRNHQVMLNGDGLLSNPSTMQACIIVPQPGNDDIYYVFTADAFENAYMNGYRYTVVDMTRDNGNGEVISKNVLLYASGTERMTAIRHADGIGVWVVTNDYNSNVFRSWLVTCSGVQATPVVSTIGTILDQYPLMGIGMMKASPDGKLLCQTHFPLFDEDLHVPNFAQLFDFDNATGTLSNLRTIAFPDAQLTGCEFSPDSKLLYLTRSYDKSIDQVEATLPTAAAINSSRVTINMDVNFYGIQLAPDGKIYLSQPSLYLGAINQPNIKGLGCDYQKEQVDISFRFAYAGLPSFINDLSFNPLNTFGQIILDSCAGMVQFQGQSSMPGTLVWAWDFGDGNTSSLQNPVHTFSPADTEYVVKVEISSNLTCGKFKIAKTVKPRGIVTKLDFDFFASCDSGYIRFINKNPSLQGAGGTYSWDFGDGQTSADVNPKHSYAQQGNYSVKLKFNATKNCLDDSVTKTVTMQPLPVTISDDQTIFIGQKIQLFVSGPGTRYNWFPPTGLSSTTVARPLASPVADIIYKARVSNNSGCSGEDSVKITVIDLDEIYVPSGFTPNNDGRNDIIRPFFGTKFSLKEFSIFNRWGQRVYSTSKRDEGWSGKINGVEQNPGVYIWVLKYINDKNLSVERKGSLVLLR